MELLEGRTLSDRIAIEGGLAIEDALDVGQQVLSALAASHQRGIVHRDLKPDNVFLAQRENRTVVKLLDFGISKTIGEESLSLTKTGTVVGTPFYLAPEQARGDEVDQRADVWAMGVLLYEMITGTTPFRADNYNKLIVRILTTRPEPPSSRQPWLSPQVERDHDRARARTCRTLPGRRPDARGVRLGAAGRSVRADSDPAGLDRLRERACSCAARGRPHGDL
jgi:serine/threonine-protein kinase